MISSWVYANLPSSPIVNFIFLLIFLNGVSWPEWISRVTKWSYSHNRSASSYGMARREVNPSTLMKDLQIKQYQNERVAYVNPWSYHTHFQLTVNVGLLIVRYWSRCWWRLICCLRGEHGFLPSNRPMELDNDRRLLSFQPIGQPPSKSAGTMGDANRGHLENSPFIMIF